MDVVVEAGIFAILTLRVCVWIYVEPGSKHVVTLRPVRMGADESATLAELDGELEHLQTFIHGSTSHSDVKVDAVSARRSIGV